MSGGGQQQGGGLIILARSQQVWTSPDLSKSLTLHNDTGTDKSISGDDCAAMVASLDPGNYQTTWNGSAWSAPSE